MHRKKIVFLLGSYFPYYSAVGKCMGNIIDELSTTHSVEIICFRSKWTSALEEQHKGCLIRRIYTSDMARYLIWSAKREGASGWARYRADFMLFCCRAKNYLRTVWGRESIDKNLVNEYLKILSNREERIDMLIPVCNPFEGIVAAQQYQAQHPNIAIVPVLFDKFSVSQALHRNQMNRALKMNRHLTMERSMLEQSDGVLFVDSWQEHLMTHFSEYQDKFHLIEHPLLCKPVAGEESIDYGSSGLHIVYTGVVDYKIRPPQYTLDLFVKLFREQKMPAVQVHFYSLGNAVKEIVAAAGTVPDHILFHGAVPNSVACAAIRGADVLLSIGNTDLTQTASKIFEYMASGKPIIHFYHDVREPAYRILESYPNACLIKQDRGMREDAEAKILHFIQQKHELYPYDKLEQQYATAKPAYSADIINNLLESQGTR